VDEAMVDLVSRADAATKQATKAEQMLASAESTAVSSGSRVTQLEEEVARAVAAEAGERARVVQLMQAVQTIKTSFEASKTEAATAATAATTRITELECVLIERGNELENANSQAIATKSKCAKLEETVALLSAQTERLESAEGEVLESRQALTDATRREEAAVSARDSALTTVTSLKTDLETALREASTAHQLVDRMRQEASSRDAARNARPRAFRVVLRCGGEKDGGGDWCLLARSDDSDDGGAGAGACTAVVSPTGELLEWRSDIQVQQWIEDRRVERVTAAALSRADREKERDGSSAGSRAAGTAVEGSEPSFSIDADDEDEDEGGEEGAVEDHPDDILPPTVQEIVASHMSQATAAATAHSTHLQEELISAQSAFDKYRDRARDNVMRASTDQRVAEEGLCKSRAELKAAHAALEAARAEAAAKAEAAAAATAAEEDRRVQVEMALEKVLHALSP
jgi:hypothetical protein